MENNKAYLKHLSWVFLAAVANSLLTIYGIPLLKEQFEKNDTTPHLIIAIFFSLAMYVTLGFVTSKMRQALIACAASVFFTVLFYVIPSTLNIAQPKQFIYYFIIPVPLFLFITLQTGFKKKSILVYLAALVAINIYSINFYVRDFSRNIGRVLDSDMRFLSDILPILFTIATFIFEVIAVCELINYFRDNKSYKKTTLLNLGNNYDKLNSTIAFWTSKTMLWMLVAGSSVFVNNYLGYMSFVTNNKNPEMIFYNYTGILTMISLVIVGLFIAWYTRKLLLEHFITYNINSKFTYWFALFPVIGIITFLVAQSEKPRQEKYQDKVFSVGSFAGSNPMPVTIVIFILLFLRMIFQGSHTPAFVYVSIIISAALFIWMILDRSGYYINALVNLLGLTAIIVAGFFVTSRRLIDTMSFYYALLLLGIIQLILFFPIYHFDQFVYTPSENPEPEAEKSTDIFQ